MVVLRVARWGLLTAALTGLVAVAPLRAESEISFASLQIELWPEFDRVDPLVLIGGALDPAVELPARLTLTIPAAAGAPHAVAVRDAAGNLLNASYSVQRSADKIAITFSATYPDIWLEYYDPALAIFGRARTYHFRWITQYSTRQTTVVMRPPAGARDFTTKPVSRLEGADQNGSSFYSTELGERSAGQSIEVSLEYARETDSLSAAAVEQTPSPVAPAPQPQSPRQSGLSAASMAALATAALVLVGLVIFYLRRQGAPTGPDAAPAESRSGRAERSARFCTACGKRVAPDYKFCANCGAGVQS